MNFLSHHEVARRAATRNAPPELFLGNLLPDLLSQTGEGRLRAGNLPPVTADTALTAGIRLHLAADTAFHGSSAFKRVNSEAGDHLRRQPFASPPRRLFFVAHVFVELALDAYLLEDAPGIADDLYGKLAAADLGISVRETAGLLGSDDRSDALPELAPHIEWFTRVRYLLDYREPEGLTEAMRRISLRAGVPNFVSDTDASRLAAAFTGFRDVIRRAAPELLRLPAITPGPWYNVGETPPATGGGAIRESHPPGRDEDADGDA